MTERIDDILVIGGGPTGLFSAFYAGIRNASCKIIDSLPSLGGRLTALYPEKYIYDVAGFPKVLTRDLVDNLIEQAMVYHPTICLNETAQMLRKRDDNVFELTTDKDVHLGRTIVIAGGVGTYRPKKHAAPGADVYENKGVDYAVTHKRDYTGKRVVIAGGGDSALDWANELVAVGAKVTLVHRSDKFRAHEDSVTKFSNTGSAILLNTEITEFSGRHNKLTSVKILDTVTNETATLEVDHVLVMFGFNSSLGKIREWGLTLNGDYLAVSERMETNIPGIYAAGDITDHSAKLKLIATGFAEAAIAVNFAKNFINPKEKVQPLHSTTIMEIKERKAKLEK